LTLAQSNLVQRLMTALVGVPTIMALLYFGLAAALAWGMTATPLPPPANRP